MAKFVRARKGTPALLHPDTGLLIVPSPDTPVADSDPLVKAHKWAFVSDEELAEEADTAARSHGPVVEQATASPGEKRTTRRTGEK